MKALFRTTALLIMIAIAGCGKSSSNGNGLTPIAFLFVVGQGSNSIIALGEQPTGELGSLGVPSVATNPIPVAMTQTASKNFIYVANSTSNTVSGFNLDHVNGVLTPVGTAVLPSPVGTNPIGVGADSKSQFLFVLNQGSSNISVFSIDATRGLLTEISGSPFSVPANPQFLVVSPTAGFLYVAGGTSGVISGFAIGSDGSLSPIAGSPFASGTDPMGMAIDPQGMFLYAADEGTNSVLSFSIQGTGALTPVAGSPFAAGTQPVSVAVDASSTFLYTANFGSNDTSAYMIANGVLTQLAGSPYATGGSGAVTATQPVFVTLSTTNQFVFVANSGARNIMSFLRAPDGTLTFATDAPFSQTVAPAWLLSAK
ncbi:MAG TPA: beta-propeller fold lactonase family protein [Terriglobales bacterium]